MKTGGKVTFEQTQEPGERRRPAVQTGDPTLDKIVQRLVNEYEPERIYLFGSQARGQATAESDYDLMVIVPVSDEPHHRRMRRAYRALWGIRASVDVLVWTRDEFDRQVPVVASLPATIVREGKLLHAA